MDLMFTSWTYTCALCGGRTPVGIYSGLCASHWYEYSVTGTYAEKTPTGTFLLPQWLRIFANEHKNFERRMKKMNHAEVVFSDVYYNADEKENPPEDRIQGGRSNRQGG